MIFEKKSLGAQEANIALPKVKARSRKFTPPATSDTRITTDVARTYGSDTIELQQDRNSTRYLIRIMLSGCVRCFDLESLFPCDDDNKMMLASMGEDNEIGPALLEMALMRVYGTSYMELNTTPSIEMHHFLGWIPEIVWFKDVTNKDNLWNRMK